MNRRQAYNEFRGLAGEQGARWLLEHIAGPISLLEFDGSLSVDEQRRFEDILARLNKCEPLQYILGYWDFYGYCFKVDKRALIPRPETELLVEAALKAIKDVNKPSVIDIGAGTGCIGIALKLQRPDAAVELVDISTNACGLAKENAALLKADVTITNCDMRELGGKYDLIVSNPPYIKTGDIDSLDKSVRLYEPADALDGGNDGFDYYRELNILAGRCLGRGGHMALEIGAGQRLGIENIFSSCKISFIKDLQGIDRIAVIQK